jgi:hypothetical protein
MWPIPVNHAETGANEKTYGNRKGSQHYMDGRRCCRKESRKILSIAAKRKSVIFINGSHNSTRMKRKQNISKPSMSPTMQLQPNVLPHERKSILCFQSHRSEIDIGRKRNGVYSHSLNRSKFQSR